ncbi:MAG TPA: S-methyl-5-thioribose-1-phosphate isomerase [Chthoniobacterales bacterium]
MRIEGKHYRTIWSDGELVFVIDQTKLPHEFKVVEWLKVEDAAQGIATMVVRGAPLIGAAAAYGMALAMKANPSDQALERGYDLLVRSRPTAVNLRWALDRMSGVLQNLAPSERAAAAYREALRIADEDAENCSLLGEHGLVLLRDAWTRLGQKRPLQVLTHCNAGWLATVDWGTALAPIYKAFDAGIPIHVWVDETRPRNQGASLTAWELGHHGVPHTLVVDNAGGHLMQHGMVDLCIVGSDRTTASGDVCNKIGTYLKALAAHDNGVPFYVALPFSTVDWRLRDGVKEIPIEERSSEEVTHIMGKTAAGEVVTVKIAPDGSPAANFAFDVTPARYVTGLITERGICAASAKGLAQLGETENCDLDTSAAQRAMKA